MTKQGNWITNISLALFIGMLMFSAVAAGDLSQLKADGLIGEQLNGYIGLVRKDVPADVKRLVDDVNALIEVIKREGGQILNGPMEVPGGDMIATCLDPQGAMFAIHSLAAK